jgi:hypothetical protein
MLAYMYIREKDVGRCEGINYEQHSHTKHFCIAGCQQEIVHQLMCLILNDNAGA